MCIIKSLVQDSDEIRMDTKVTLFCWLSKDGKLLLAARTLRTFAYGFLSVILAIYLKLVGIEDFYIGLILTATLVNSVIFTLITSFYADRIGRRKILILYAALMSLSGVIFFVTTNYIALITSALIGTINVTGTETGAFLSIEQAVLPQTINDIKKRNTVLRPLQYGWNLCNVCRCSTFWSTTDHYTTVWIKPN